MSEKSTPDHEHLLGCPAAVSVPGAQGDCQCGELARLFRVPTPDACFGDADPERGRARWTAARREASARYERLMRDLVADERTAFARYRQTADDKAAVERDIETARRLLREYLASGPS